jgi:hypothetical protein
VDDKTSAKLRPHLMWFVSYSTHHEVIKSFMAKPTADWEKVGDKFYRKIQLYTSVFDQDLELENYIVTGAPYAGAIGMSAHVLRQRRFPALFHVYDGFPESYGSIFSIV